MRYAISALLIAAPFVLAGAPDKTDTISSAKVSAEGTKKEWSIKAVSAKAGHDSGVSTEVEVLVRFEKDLPRAALDEVKACFIPENLNALTPVKVCFIDADGVVVHMNRIREIKGELAGKAGDAFRVISDCDNEVITKVKRIELRCSSKKLK